jgi:prophage antirepressor-like protein
MSNLKAALSARQEPLAVFSFPETGQNVRTVTLDTEPWFVAVDVAEILDLGNLHSSLAHLDDDERSLHTVERGQRSMSIVSEPGLYSLILRSRKPQAKAFKRWVTHEVLPAIRKTGSYSVALPQSYAEALRELASTVEQRDHAVAELETAKPKADAFDTYIAADDTDMLLRTAAKMLGTGERTLRRHLLDAGFIFWTRNHTACGRAQYEPYAAHQGNGLFALKKTTVTHETFGDCNHQTVYVTPKGLEAVRRSIAKQASAHAAIEGGVR